MWEHGNPGGGDVTSQGLVSYRRGRIHRLEANAAECLGKGLGMDVLPGSRVEAPHDGGFDPLCLAGDGRHAGLDAELLTEKAFYVTRFHDVLFGGLASPDGLIHSAFVQTDELALFVKRADSYLADMYGLHMEFVHPDVVQIVENKVVTCKMVALEFQDIMVKDAKVRILALRDEQGLIVVASHPYDLARLCYG